MVTDTEVAAGPSEAEQLQQVPRRIVAAWADHDAEAFAATFAEDGSMILPGDVYLTGREAIRDYMAGAFAGPYQGTRVTGDPVAARPLADGLALVISEGGVLAPGDDAVTPERAVRASWLLTKQDGDWLIAAYQNTPLAAS